MKIHDKFIIELKEVIKGYGNDTTAQDPFKFPCDYKFYEIEGIAICEKSFKKMKRLEDEVNAVLDKIIAEIEDEADYAYADFDKYKEDILHAEPDELPDDDFRYGLRRAIEIINKYTAESEGKE